MSAVGRQTYGAQSPMVWSVRLVDSVVLSPYRGAYVMEYSLAGLCFPRRSRPQPPSSLTRIYSLGDLLLMRTSPHGPR